MPTTRYHQGKNLEEDEANAIGTEYFHSDQLSPSDAVQVRIGSRQYTDSPYPPYKSVHSAELRQINEKTGQLQNRLWVIVSGPASAQPTPVRACGLWQE
jgi:hypothetical protein